jgi:sugar phosphate isomerase/epimerase
VTDMTGPEGRILPGVSCGRSVASLPADLANDLSRAVTAGYTAAELKVETLHCIVGGRLIERNVARVAEICAGFSADLLYSVHSPAVLDLRHQKDPDLHREILLCCVRFSAAVGARVLVVHYEARSDDPAVEAQFKAAIEEAAEVAGRHGVILGIENIEVERAERVLEFLEALCHPWVRMTYDFAHNYLASDLFGYDYLRSTRDCVPYAAHLHLTDNFGRFNMARLGDWALYQATPTADITVTGMGDAHLPLGWGILPAAEVYNQFAANGYRGLLISEHRRNAFAEQDAEICSAMRELVAAAP